MSDKLVVALRSGAILRAQEDNLAADIMIDAADEIERLQNIIDSRPAINAGLPDSYISWSQSIYAMEAAQVRGHNS